MAPSLHGALLGALALLLSSTPVRAQGSDSCASPTAISGPGPFAFNNSSATNSPEGQPPCGGTANNRDVWFAWTAAASGNTQVSTCGGASIDSVLAVYAGSGCPSAAALACNDDACGLQSTVNFTATAGQTYTIRLGSFGSTAGGSGTFTVSAVTGCAFRPGPDVIVGDLTGPSNYTPAGGIDAIALGTTSCNLGDTWLNWISSTNQHPVIGGNLYKFKVVNGAGRFEQIGQSWLKHGFYALSQNLCCPNCSSTDGTHLGVGCSDPYTSARNGTQSGLGPRWQVNANTGAFTYPPANPSWSGSVARRLEFLLADVESTAGVRYFGESQYVTPDDAAAGNQNNNASWREMTVSGSSSNWAFAFTGTTQREQSAIRAWPLAESGVTLTDVQLAGEGLLVLGHKVTALGGGQWHYEYALYNMNSDDGVRSFALPAPAGVTITNIGFHDVAYRNGDGPGNVNFDGTDWPATQSGGVLTWATQTFAQNQSANALRWGTTYNFRFDANAAPTSGTITLGRYKSGGTRTVTASVPGAGAPDADGDGIPDASDNCPTVPNPSQADADSDGIGDACDTCTDTDGDGFGNPGFPANTCPTDGCPNDPLKSAPGACGCGVPDTDSDGDGTPNCIDGCPNDPLKIAPGVCGCGVPDTDTDGDGTPDCNDGCPNDPLKTAAGACGCGVPDTDSDGDGTPNCIDGCPNDPLKIAPGACGCGTPDTDSDGDGTPNCLDGCPNDPLKIAPGVCGCGTPDTDSDGDGTPNCNDGCPNDPLKIAPGICGCGTPDTDTDGDGTPDCNDGCPNDPLKTAPGICGCGVADNDTDGDGTPDCNDGCPNDPLKIAPGICGCGASDTDTNGNGLADCLDFTLSELLFNPPGTDQGQESIEIRGVPGTLLANMFLLVIEGDAAGAGVIDQRIDLSAYATGSNGLLLIRDSAVVLSPPPSPGTSVVVMDFTPDIENGTNTYVLGIGAPPAVGTDLDTNNDGVLDVSLGAFSPLDAVGMIENDAGGNIGYGTQFGGVNVGPFAAFTPDGLMRTYSANGAPCIWTGGDVLGTSPGPYTFDFALGRTFGFDQHGVTSGVTLSLGVLNAVFDADGDGLANACDACTDTDGDGFGDPGFPANTCGLDGCPTDPLKSAPGACGCGLPETDTDGDGTPDCVDGCPADPLKTAAGACGCGVPDTDTDGDGTADCNDGCPSDPLKIAPGICGCGVSDADTDGDGTPDCNDGCPNDPLKIAAGICGCGTPDTDTDGDGTADCNDGCPNDPLKTAPGLCGCGVADTDTDGDGTPDCTDGCPNDPLKTAAGMCGCGTPDTDTDGDGTADCNDGCPNDPLKTAPGVCGCGVADTDTDGDGTADCSDGCPNDPLKVAPGICGCGVADTDSDGDGTPDCNDGCPADPLKTAPGQCGCGVADADGDGDGVADCVDNCASTPNAGQADADNDGVGDACDNCVAIANPSQADCDNDQIGDACAIAAGAPDCNANGIPDACDLASGTSLDLNLSGVPDECEAPALDFCPGDGSGTACPCGNSSPLGAAEGCLHSLGTGGKVRGTGLPSLAADSLVLTGTQMPNSSALYFQGTTQQNAGLGAAFGDGLRCAGGSVIRLGTKINAAGASQYPAAGDPSVSVRGQVVAPGTRTYQVWYRNAGAFCTPSTFNLSNGVVVIWGA